MWGFILSTITAAVISPNVINWYQKNQWVDDPNRDKHVKKTHRQPIPRGGGLVIYAAIALISIVLLPVDGYLLAILAGGALLTLVGWLDDIFDLSPYLRIFTGLLASLIVVGAGIGIAYVSNPIGHGVIRLDQPQFVFWLLGEERHVWVLSSLFAVLFINWNMNIVNWSKGVDGQLPGFVSAAAIFIGLLAASFHDSPTQFTAANLAYIVAGAYFGLLVWNWYPQKIMPGYGAGSLAGYFLSVLAILSGAKLATTVMVLAIPTADGIFTILRRLAAKRSPFWGDRGHLHHRLMDVFGWGRRRIALFYWLSSILMGWLSLNLGTAGKMVMVVVATAAVFTLHLFARYYQKSHLQPKQFSSTKR